MGLLIGFYTILYIVLAFLNIRWALLVLLVSLPSYMIRFSVFGLPLTLLEVMVLTVFGVFLFGSWRRVIGSLKLAFSGVGKVRKVAYPFGNIIIGICLVSLISAFVGGMSSVALGILKAYFVEPIMLYLVIVNVVGDKKKGKLGVMSVVAALGFSAFSLSVLAFVQYFTGLFMPVEWIGTGRVTSIYSYPNALGLYLGPLVMVMMGALFSGGGGGLFDWLRNKYENNWLGYLGKIFLALVIGMSLMAIYFAKSEGAMLGVLCAMVVFGLFYGKKTGWAMMLVVVVGSMGLYFLQSNNEEVRRKLVFEDLSSVIRLIGWRETVWALKDKYWFLGVGLSGFQDAVAPYHLPGFFYNFDNDSDFRRKIVIFDEKYKAEHWQPLEIYMYPHNIILNFWVELGIFGMILFVWLIGGFVVKAAMIGVDESSDDRYMALGLLGAMMVVIVHGVVDVPYFKNDLAVLFWVLVALLGVLLLNKRK